MKLTVVFLFLACLQVHAKVNAQITLSVTNEPLTKVIDALQTQSGYDFLFSYELLQQSGKVTASVKNVTLKQALDVCLKGTGLTYEIRVNTVLIKKKEANFAVALVDEALPPPPIEIRGKIMSDKGTPLAGATINEKGTGNVVQSKEDGSFIINVAGSKSILVVSYIGFETLETPAAHSGSIVLKQKIAQNEEIVVMGYGTQKKATVTGSVTQITGKEILKSPVMNTSNALVGRMPGLTAVQKSGEPGQDGSTIRIRGVNTLGNNDALVVVDGVPGRSLDRIDPQSIESISVLKDALAAIYGSRAANGVILVTTKRGKLGKPQFAVELNQGFMEFGT